MKISDRIKSLERELNNYNKLDVELPTHVFSQKELILGLSLIKYLADLKNYSNTKSIRNNLEQIFEYNSDLVEFASEILDKTENIRPITLTKEDIMEDVIGNWLQLSLESDKRKSLAVNYTIGIEEILPHFDIPSNEINSIVDPYCGSGRLIIGILPYLKKNSDLSIRINDIMPLAVLNAFAVIRVQFFGDLSATIQNGFLVEGNYDLVLINPPFTRSQLIPDTINKSLSFLKDKYTNYNTGRAGLHFWAILHSIEILKNSGKIIAVLPLSTISSNYSKPLKKALLEHFSEIDVLSYQFKKSYSQDSELKEMVLFARGEGNNTVNFVTADNSKKKIVRKYSIVFDKLKDLWNWSAQFRNKELLTTVEGLIDGVPLISLKNQYNIIRGIEMYGPNFFFFPNKYYEIRNQHNSFSLTNKKDPEKTYHLPKNNLCKILRKPSIYTSSITPEVNEYCLTIEEKPVDDVGHYLKDNKENAKAALRRFGDNWFKHPLMQIKSKYPFGHIFLIDKLDLTSTPTLGYYTDEKLPSTKNFYVLQTKLDPSKTKFLAAWINSSLYLALYLARRREIGGTYGRLQIIDYHHNPLLLDPESIKKNSLFDKILHTFDILRKLKLPSLVDQIFMEERVKLDRLFIDYFSVRLKVNKLHGILENVFDELTRR